MKKLLYISFLLYLAAGLHAQPLDEASRRDIELPDGLRITVFASADASGQYFYIPTALQLAGTNSRPEISLITYRHGDNGPFEGGLLHFLIHWGLTPEQEEMVTATLKQQTDSTAVLMGPADIDLSDNNTLDILPGDAIGDLLRRSSTSPLRVPDLAVHKTAASFRLGKEDAAALLEAIGRPAQLKNTRFTCRYYYYTVTSRKDGLRSRQKREGRMDASFATWIDQLVKYNLLQTRSL